MTNAGQHLPKTTLRLIGWVNRHSETARFNIVEEVPVGPDRAPRCSALLISGCSEKAEHDETSSYGVECVIGVARGWVVTLQKAGTHSG